MLEGVPVRGRECVFELKDESSKIKDKQTPPSLASECHLL